MMAARNPFVYGEIVAPEAFLDRETEREQLARDLLDGQKMFLVAPRRYGKSSLISVVLDDLRARDVRTVALTVARYATYRSFLEGFAEACLRAADLGTRIRDLLASVFTLRPRLRYETAPTRGQSLGLELEASRSARDEQRLAREVFSLPGVLAERTGALWVIALDEFQNIIDFDGASVEGVLRAAVQTQRRVGYVFAGSEPSLMAQILRPRRPFYKAGPLLTLGKIPSLVFVDAIVARFESTGITMPRDLAADLVDRAQNVPYDIQRLAHETWDDVVRAGASGVMPATLETTIVRLLGSQRPLLEAAWERLALAKRSVLRAVAREEGLTLLSAAVRARYGLGPKSSVQRALASLVRDEWITREGERYVFVDSLNREYVLRETR